MIKEPKITSVKVFEKSTPDPIRKNENIVVTCESAQQTAKKFEQ